MHVKDTINHQLLPGRNIFWTPRAERTTAGLMPPGAFLVSVVFFFLVVTCPRPPVFAGPNKYSSCLSLHRQGLLSLVTVTYLSPPVGREQRWGLMPLRLFLFFGGHLPQTSSFRWAKQILVVSFATQARTFILSDRNIFYTPGGKTTAGSNAPGAFLVEYLITS